MSNVHLLGSGGGAAQAERTTTMLALESAEGVILIDCGGDAAQRLAAHGLDVRSVRAVVVTHEHADHVGGLPLLLERLWLAGRSDPLPVIGIARAVRQAIALHDAFDVSSWPGYPGIAPQVIAGDAGGLVLSAAGWRLQGAPGRHAVPVLALRAEAPSGAVMAYSCDTAYAPEIVALARDADLLLHEAGAASERDRAFHSSAVDAARVAVEAGVKRLALVHLDAGFDEGSADVREARRRYPNLEIGRDGAVYSLATASGTRALGGVPVSHKRA
jgi:ribonuclease Z